MGPCSRGQGTYARAPSGLSLDRGPRPSGEPPSEGNLSSWGTVLGMEPPVRAGEQGGTKGASRFICWAGSWGHRAEGPGRELVPEGPPLPSGHQVRASWAGALRSRVCDPVRLEQACFLVSTVFLEPWDSQDK